MNTSERTHATRRSLLARITPTKQWLSLIIATVVTLAYVLLWEHGTPPAIEEWIEAGAEGKEQPDAHIESLVMRQFGDAGQLQFQLNSPRAKPFAKDDATYFDDPEIDYFDEHSKWRSNSKSGIMSNANNSVYLRDAVVLNQLDKDARLSTNQLWVFIDQKGALTDDAVTITTSGGTLQGKGLAADFNKQTLKLLSNVQGVYEKSPR